MTEPGERHYRNGCTPAEEGAAGELKVREVAPRFTYNDYLKLTGDERYEVIEGELVLVPSPTTIHQRMLLRIRDVLHAHVTEKNLGEVFVAPLDVVLSDSNVLQPDVIFVAGGRTGVVTDTHIAGAPDLVVEVVSKNSAERDRTKKRAIYQRFGVKEYWLVDPEQRTIEVFAASHRVYSAASGSVRLSTVLPELVVDIAGMFAASTSG